MVPQCLNQFSWAMLKNSWAELSLNKQGKGLTLQGGAGALLSNAGLCLNLSKGLAQVQG